MVLAGPQALYLALHDMNFLGSVRPCRFPPQTPQDKLSPSSSSRELPAALLFNRPREYRWRCRGYATS